MQVIPEINDLQAYLKASEIIDFDTEILALADEIESESKNKLDYIKKAYEYVRDEIAHSADINHNLLTCKASEVLREKHGICFAKSHLLAALLRCKEIPVGFCYQKLILDDETAPYLVFHGLNAVYIEAYNKWIRLDARGNKKGINAEFSLDEEKLAFPVRSERGEQDIKIIFAQPHKNVIDKMTRNKTRIELWGDLPTEIN